MKIECILVVLIRCYGIIDIMIEVIGATYKYFGYEECLMPISLEIKDGEKVVLFGSLSSGKSTLLKLIAGIYKPNRGSVLLDKKEVSLIHPRNRGIAYLFRYLNLPRFKDVKHILMKPYRLRGFSRKQSQSFANQAITKFGLESIALKPGVLLNRFERVRVAVARAFMRDNRMLIIDNPLSNLDISTRREYYGILHTLIDNYKGSVIYATDDIEEIKYFRDKVIFIEYGRVLDYDAYLNMLSRPKALRVATTLLKHNISIFRARLNDNKMLINGVNYPLMEGREFPDEFYVLIPTEDIKLRREGQHSVKVNYIMADNVACLDLENETVYGMCEEVLTEGFITIDFSNALIYDILTEKIID